jgi:hypothetical protein
MSNDVTLVRSQVKGRALDGVKRTVDSYYSDFTLVDPSSYSFSPPAQCNDEWTQRDIISQSGNFTGRSGFGMSSSDNNLFLLGGYDGTYTLADMWISKDGINFNCTEVNQFYNGRCCFGSVGFSGGLYIVGGRSNRFDGGFDIYNEVVTLSLLLAQVVSHFIYLFND